MWKKINFLLSKRQKFEGVLLILILLIVSFVDVLGIASIMPFVTVAANPGYIHESNILSYVYSILNFSSEIEFVLVLGVSLFLIFILSVFLKSFSVYFQNSFVIGIEKTMSAELFGKFLNQPYSWHISNNSSMVGTSILSEISAFNANAITPIINIFANSILVILIFIVLVIVDPFIAFTTSAILIILYGSLLVLVNRSLSERGALKLKANQRRFKLTSEASAGIKVIKLANLESNLSEQFTGIANEYSRHQIFANVIGQVPKFIIEGVAFGGITLLVVLSLNSDKGLAISLGMISLYAFAGYRLLPALQAIYNSLALIKFSVSTTTALYNEFKNTVTSFSLENNIDAKLQNCIEFRDVSFAYPDSKSSIFREINIRIPVNTTLGVVGKSGTGKTTFVDILSGLLSPSSGIMMIDGNVLEKSQLKNWQKTIGYVPQNIFLFDGSILENIALGEAKSKIDRKKVEQVSKMANLHEFIVSDLQEGYDSCVGENGVKLSGGQRQRVGIARALYSQPSVLIFDESTSALDADNESLIMKEIHQLLGKMTIIIISHKHDVLDKCNSIISFEGNGRCSIRTYDEVVTGKALKPNEN